MSEYTAQAEAFLAAHNLTFRAVFVGEDCPTFCEDAQKGIELIPGTFPRKNHIHGSHWRLTVSGKDRQRLTADYWDSYNDALIRAMRKDPTNLMYSDVARSVGRKPGDGAWEMRLKYPKDPMPTAYDMFTAITKNEPGVFEDFCADFGYDSDSIRAESVYRAVVKEWREVSKFFSAAELEELQEIQ